MDEKEARDEDGGAGETKYEDVMGDGTLLVQRVVINKNPGPHTGDKVTVRWTRSIPELGKSYPTEDLTFVLGDGDTEQAVELITTLMKLGEKFNVISGFQYMYGEVGQPPDIPPKANFKFEIELLCNEGIVDYPTMSFDTRFNEAKKKKERGNTLFRRRNFHQALNSYMTAYKIVDTDLGFDYPDEPAEQLQEVQEFRAVILCNTSVAQLKLQMADAAVLTAKEATKILPSYSKAFYRLGQAYDKVGKTDETITAYKRALQMNADGNKAKLSESELSILQSEVDRLTEKKQKAKESEKQMYSRMFGQDTPTKNGTKTKGSQNSKQNISKSPSNKADTKKLDLGAAASIDHFVTMATEITTNQEAALEGASGGTPLFNEDMFVVGMKIANAYLATQGADKGEASMPEVLKESSVDGLMKQHVDEAMETHDPEALMKHFQQMFVQDPTLITYLMQMQKSLAAGMEQKEAMDMTDMALAKLGLDPNASDPGNLYRLSEKMAQIIPPDVRAHLENMAAYSADQMVADLHYKSNDGEKNEPEQSKEHKSVDMDTKIDQKCGDEIKLNTDGQPCSLIDAETENEGSSVAQINQLLGEKHCGAASAGDRSDKFNAQHSLELEFDGATSSGDLLDKLSESQHSLEVKSNVASGSDDKNTIDMISLWEKKIHEHVFSTKVRDAREEILRKMEAKQGVNAAVKTIEDRPLQLESRDMDKPDRQDGDYEQTAVKEKVDNIENIIKIDEDLPNNQSTGNNADINMKKNEDDNNLDNEETSKEEKSKMNIEVGSVNTVGNAGHTGKDKNEENTILTEIAKTCDSNWNHITKNTKSSLNGIMATCDGNRNLITEKMQLSQNADLKFAVQGVKEKIDQFEAEQERNSMEAWKVKQSKKGMEKISSNNKGSWLQTAGYTVLGVGVIGLISFGIYRYTRK